jgi:phytoene dehydrogenase-like protein
MRIAVIGGGVSGLSAAWALSRRHHVTLFEADARPGGHTHTVDVEVDGWQFPVDTGFLVFNERTYPNLCALFDHLGVASVASEMSFSVRIDERRLEWAGSSLATVFAQKRNLVKPEFWGMLKDILRFNREATARVAAGVTGRRDHRAVPRGGALRARLPRLVPAADERRDLVVPDRADARLSRRHLPALLPQPRTAAGQRPPAGAPCSAADAST